MTKEKVDFSPPYMKIKLSIVFHPLCQSLDVFLQSQFWIAMLMRITHCSTAAAMLSTDNTGRRLAWIKSNPGFVVGIDDLGDLIHCRCSSLRQLFAVGAYQQRNTGPLCRGELLPIRLWRDTCSTYGDEVDPNLSSSCQLASNTQILSVFARRLFCGACEVFSHLKQIVNFVQYFLHDSLCW